MFCPNCGNQVTEGDQRCPQCGYVFASAWTPDGSQRSGSSLSSSYFVREGATAAHNLAEVVANALHEFGPEVLKTPRRMISYAMDYIPDDDRVGMTFIMHCDEEFLGIYDKALARRASESLEDAAQKATHLLTDDRSIVERMATLVSESVAQGLANYVGIPVTFRASSGRTLRLIECPHCGAQNPDTNECCNVCGRPLRGAPPRNTVPCPHCGAQNEKTNDYCQVCGRPMRTIPPRTTVPCPHCGAQNEKTNDFCQVCGRPMRGTPPQNSVPCPHCGAQNLQTNDFCQACGRPMRGKQDRKPWLIPVIAALVGVLVVVFVLNAGGFFSSIDSSGGEGTGGSSVTTTDKPVSGGSDTDTDTDTTSESVNYPDPVFTKAKASSTLQGDGNSYAPEQVLDDNHQTCWAEGAGPGQEDAWKEGKLSDSEAQTALGIGEWIELGANDEQHVEGLEIINGYSKAKGEDWTDRSNGDTFYYDNPRIKKMTISFSDDTEETYDLKDAGPGKTQRIEFEEPHDTTFVRLTILEVYDTSMNGGRCTWPDTSIDKISVF